jgi:hypothetical protein
MPHLPDQRPDMESDAGDQNQPNKGRTQHRRQAMALQMKQGIVSCRQIEIGRVEEAEKSNYRDDGPDGNSQRCTLAAVVENNGSREGPSLRPHGSA